VLQVVLVAAVLVTVVVVLAVPHLHQDKEIMVEPVLIPQTFLVVVEVAHPLLEQMLVAQEVLAVLEPHLPLLVHL
jgi:hypothetical protein